MLGRLQERLQRGKLWRLGNLISDVRWMVWRAAGGRYPDEVE